jgi:hypothetical protein
VLITNIASTVILENFVTFIVRVKYYYPGSGFFSRDLTARDRVRTSDSTQERLDTVALSHYAIKALPFRKGQHAIFNFQIIKQ